MAGQLVMLTVMENIPTSHYYYMALEISKSLIFPIKYAFIKLCWRESIITRTGAGFQPATHS